MIILHCPLLQKAFSSEDAAMKNLSVSFKQQNFTDSHDRPTADKNLVVCKPTVGYEPTSEVTTIALPLSYVGALRMVMVLLVNDRCDGYKVMAICIVLHLVMEEVVQIGFHHYMILCNN